MTEQPFAIPAAALFVLAIPLVIGVIPRNRYYGMRTARTLADERAWYRANRVAGAAVMAASAIYGAVAVLWPYSRSASDNFSVWVAHVGAFAVPLVVGLSLAARSARAR